MNTKTVLKTSMITLALGGGLALSSLLFAADEKAPAPSTETIKGEKHKGCAEKCIKGGGPVGLLSGDRLYLVVGDHQPVNEELAPKAAQTVTLNGKVVERHGMRMIENAQIVE